MFEKLEKFFGGNKEKPPLVHPDFGVKEDYDDGFYWWWNYTDIARYLKTKDLKKNKNPKIVKVAFPFDDPRLLDNCPFMCKIGKNIGQKQETQYYGVAYGTEDDIEALKEWAQRFPHAKLLTSLGFNAETTERSKIEYIKKEGVDANHKEVLQ